MRIAIINGPNLNRLGRRNPEIYGTRSFEEFMPELRASLPEVEFSYFQSNCEGALIDEVQRAADEADAIIINPGAYAHYSYALADALADAEVPVVEVHISNIHARDDFRRRSVTGACATACLTGFGLDGYRMAADYLRRSCR